MTRDINVTQTNAPTVIINPNPKKNDPSPSKKSWWKRNEWWVGPIGFLITIIGLIGVALDLFV